MAKPNYKSQPAPTGPVSRGSVSAPKALPKWNPKPQPAPTQVKTPRTIV